MIALNPDHLHATLGIGELANVAQELPVGFGEPPEIQVGKDVAEQDEAAEEVGAQDAQGVFRAAHPGA
jgi:hypothetical protein